MSPFLKAYLKRSDPGYLLAYNHVSARLKSCAFVVVALGLFKVGALRVNHYYFISLQ